MNAALPPRAAWPEAAIRFSPAPLAALRPDFGLEVGGSDLATARLRQALGTHGLLVLRETAAQPAEVLRLLGAAGAPLPAPVAPATPGWHFARGAAGGPLGLVAAQAVAGAPAMRFAGQFAAHARLDPWLAHHIEWLEAEHADAPPHPLVRLGPDGLRRGLHVDAGTGRILGLGAAESTRLLARLRQAASDPAVTYRHEWQPGDLLVWDAQAVLVEAPQGRLQWAASPGTAPRGPAAVAVPWLIAG